MNIESCAVSKTGSETLFALTQPPFGLALLLSETDVVRNPMEESQELGRPQGFLQVLECALIESCEGGVEVCVTGHDAEDAVGVEPFELCQKLGARAVGELQVQKGCLWLPGRHELKGFRTARRGVQNVALFLKNILQIIGEVRVVIHQQDGFVHKDILIHQRRSKDPGSITLGRCEASTSRQEAGSG